MCSIIGSFDQLRFEELWKLNSHRGSHSHSIGQYDPKSKMITVHRGSGAARVENLQLLPGHYGVGHCQAPTSEAAHQAIHPAEKNGAFLWHNGIIKSHRVKALQARLRSQEGWDTALLLEALLQNQSLSEIDGSFACFWYDQGSIKLFRNELCRLFINVRSFDVSSLPFSGGELVPPHVIWTLDFQSQRLIPGGTFSTKENPYLIS